MDFCKNCVFIDGAGFSLYTQIKRGRSLKGTPIKGTVPTEKGITFTVLGVTSQEDIINILVLKNQNQFFLKKKKKKKKKKKHSEYLLRF
ncbi:hypothetical protein BY458DRAFT_57476 [Sporodiniella umbellata]|nr:hypothetical protein BY458DRAFT_57476 [Sporodiniella umbellata]